MFMTIKRKHITFLSVGLLLAIAIFLNFTSSDNTSDGVEVASNQAESGNDNIQSSEAILVSAEENLIHKAKNDREVVRSKACELLNNTLSDANVSDEGKKQAESKLLKMAEDMDAEVECESMLSAKGYRECVVFISENGVNVTVNKKDLTKEDVAKINDIIFGLTGNNNIKIVEVK